MTDNTLEVGCLENGDVCINHPDLKPDENGVGHIVFTPEQARNLSFVLMKHAEKVCDCWAMYLKSEDNSDE